MPRLRFRHVRRAVGASLTALGIIVAPAFIRAADEAATGWPSYNRTLTSERYAPFDQINRSNVGRLKQLCVFDLGVDASFQTGPIVIGRMLYATTDKEIFALDADTCGLKWRVREDGPSLGLRVNRGAATLPANVRQILTRPRKAGEAEAAIDPLADPAVRTAVANATFEHLVGFQLTQDQIKYNATR